MSMAANGVRGHCGDKRSEKEECEREMRRSDKGEREMMRN